MLFRSKSWWRTASISPYRAGQRPPDWLLIEAVRHQDFVVIGFIPQPGDRLLEALIVATYDGRTLHPAGRVVGGFDNATSSALRRALDGLATGSAPDDPRWLDDRICWVTPKIVVAVKFSEWDLKGQLRFPIFSGLRPEVAPEECARTPMVEPPLRSKPRLVEIQLPRLPL